MDIPNIPDAVAWRDGMILEPVQFQRTDRRTAVLANLAGLMADPWPWGFLSISVDETALASFELRVACTGVFPNGEPFSQTGLRAGLYRGGSDGDRIDFHVIRSSDDGGLVLSQGTAVPSAEILPAARLEFRGGVWSCVSDWSPPAFLIGTDHPLRKDLNHDLGALAALGAGYATTLRMPGVAERPATRTLEQVASVLVKGVGVIEALLAAPVVSAGRLSIEALRLALDVRTAVGMYDRLEGVFDPADQRGSMKHILEAAKGATAGIGLPFRADVFRATEDSRVLTVKVSNSVSGALLLAIEASRPTDLIAARTWLGGAALASRQRIHEALTRRVTGCARQPVERDPRFGVSSGPLLALYRVEEDRFWRGDEDLALASKIAPPEGTSFSVLVLEGGSDAARSPNSH